jgi:hypothetical protein
MFLMPVRITRIAMKRWNQAWLVYNEQVKA